MAACLVPAIAGLNIIAGMAMVDSLNTMSFEQFIMEEGIVGFARRILNGIDASAKKIAADLIMSKGPGGSFLCTTRSLRDFREKLWIPRISDRTTWSEWQRRGESSAEVRARETAKKVLPSHQPPALLAHVYKQIWSIVRKAEKTRLGCMTFQREHYRFEDFSHLFGCVRPRESVHHIVPFRLVALQVQRV
jgi:trimethylamine--corrinoid protein Co-methyltransferase